MDDQLTKLEDSTARLGAMLMSTSDVTKIFEERLHSLDRAMTASATRIDGLERGFSHGLRKAFDGVIFDGKRASDALAILAETLSRSVYNAAMRPVSNQLGDVLATGTSAVLDQVFHSAQPSIAQQHPSTGGSGVNVVMNVTTPDIASFNQSRAQIAAQLSRAINSGERIR